MSRSPEEVACRLLELGVELERLEPLAHEIADWLESRGVTGATRIALLRLVDQATRYSEERVDGPGFRARADEIVELLADGDREVTEELARGVN